MKSSGAIFRFGQVEFDPSNLQLAVRGEIRALEPKSCRLLAFLVKNRGRVVTKEEILGAVWNETAVTDNALTRAVAQIRKALEDDAKEPKFIETVPTVGYRFVGVLREEPARNPAAVEVKMRRRTPLAWAAAVLLMVAVTATTVWSLRTKSDEPARSAPMPLTTCPGTESQPTFSPDGNQVAFAWDGGKNNNLDIYVKAVGSETSLRLTTDPAADASPAWSPDGKMIAFLRLRTGSAIDLMLIPALGGPERKLSSFAYSTLGGYGLSWAANSRWLAVGLPEGPGLGNALFRVSVESGQVNLLTRSSPNSVDDYPAVSPDGTRLLFVRHAPGVIGALYLVEVDGSLNIIGRPERVSTGGLGVRQFVWTPDQRDILLDASDGFYRVPLSGSRAPERLAWLGRPFFYGNVGNVGLAVSRTGNRLAFSEMRNNTNIWRLELTAGGLAATGARPEQLIASTFRDVYPQYSPNGERIVFYSSRGGSQQIWIADADGARPRQITWMQAQVTASPHWSPDDKTIAFASNQGGHYQVYTVSAEGGAPKRMTMGESSNSAVTWSRDGQWMYFASNRTGRSEVWKMPAAGGEAVQVTKNGGVKLIESADRRTLFYSKDVGDASVWSMPASGGEEVLLFRGMFMRNFAVTKQGIYYVNGPARDATATLRFYSFETGESTAIAHIGTPEYGLDVSPDGRYLVYAQMDDREGDLMLVEHFR